jgi:hypothetical protein
MRAPPVLRRNEVCQQSAGLGRVSRASPVHTAVRNCTRDEGGPFEVGSQVLISSHRKLLWLKAMVVSVAETPGPSMKCRKRIRRCQNRGLTLPPGSARGNPEVCPSGIRHVASTAVRNSRRPSISYPVAHRGHRTNRRRPRVVFGAARGSAMYKERGRLSRVTCGGCGRSVGR